jgi:hypothetical protein
MLVSHPQFGHSNSDYRHVGFGELKSMLLSHPCHHGHFLHEPMVLVKETGIPIKKHHIYFTIKILHTVMDTLWWTFACDKNIFMLFTHPMRLVHLPFPLMSLSSVS